MATQEFAAWQQCLKNETQRSLRKAPATTVRLAGIVPVCNEDRTVAELLRRLEAQPCVSQSIIVDDGFADRTWEELEKWRVHDIGCGSSFLVFVGNSSSSRSEKLLDRGVLVWRLS